MNQQENQVNSSSTISILPISIVVACFGGESIRAGGGESEAAARRPDEV